MAALSNVRFTLQHSEQRTVVVKKNVAVRKKNVTSADVTFSPPFDLRTSVSKEILFSSDNFLPYSCC